MGTHRRSLTRLGGWMLLGALAGAAVVLLMLAAARSLAPQRYVGSVLLYASPVRGDSSHGRRRLQVALNDPDFLSSVVQTAEVSTASAAQLARSVTLRPSSSSAALTELTAVANEQDDLTAALNTVAVALVQRRRDIAARQVGSRIADISTEMDALQARLTAVDAYLKTVTLPPWASASATALGSLEAERFELALATRRGQQKTGAFERQLAVLDARIEQLRLGIGGGEPITAEIFDAAVSRAAIPGQIAHLLEARETLRGQRLAEADLRIVRPATVARVPPPVRRGLWAAVFGAAIGALAVLLQWAGRPVKKRHRDGPTLESHLHVRVIGSIASALVDYGDRKMRPLAQTHPQHLAVDGVRSLHLALRVLGAQRETDGPIVMANADESQNAGHVLANLAMLAANRGERVLLIETDSGDSVLSSLFTTGTSTTLSTIMDTDTLSRKGKPRGEGGRIRFVVADDDDSPDPPVPGAFVHYFDRVYVRSHCIDRATALLKAYGGGLGVLVGGDDLPIRQWQSARDAWRESDQPLDGLIHCGHRIEERLYADV
ncbi:MAG: hypothetical protein AB8G17_09865 [Gammaproteobacteria bacterium]